MPHLSPMLWLTTILMFWFMFLMMTSRLWWANKNKIPTSSTNYTSLLQKWHWLQGGRVDNKL